MMKTYIGTKMINALPMTRLAYNEFRGWNLPADEDGNDEGYLVEYIDGGKANTEQYAGYVSWSPKDVFERVYRPVLEPHQQRVVDEKAALNTKIAALSAFVHNNPIYKTLDSAEQERLQRQLDFMCGYSNILCERIGAF